MKYVPLFILIQVVSLVLTFLGLFVVLYCLLRYGSNWPRWAWVWWNDIDKAGPKSGVWNQYYWLAIRNSCNNLRFVPGVSKAGRPLFWRTWTWRSRPYYFKAGWLSDGYPVLSGGNGKW